MLGDVTLPKMNILGPGVWFLFHFMAFRANRPIDRDGLNRLMDAFASEGPCQECCDEFTKLLIATRKKRREANTAEKMFAYTVMLHNMVNTHLHKPNITEEQAITLFSSPVPCNSASPCNDNMDGDSHHLMGEHLGTINRKNQRQAIPEDYSGGNSDGIQRDLENQPAKFRRLALEEQIMTEWYKSFAVA
jgi:hypothetical protein